VTPGEQPSPCRPLELGRTVRSFPPIHINALAVLSCKARVHGPGVPGASLGGLSRTGDGSKSYIRLRQCAMATRRTVMRRRMYDVLTTEHGCFPPGVCLQDPAVARISHKATLEEKLKVGPSDSLGAPAHSFDGPPLLRRGAWRPSPKCRRPCSRRSSRSYSASRSVQGDSRRASPLDLSRPSAVVQEEAAVYRATAEAYGIQLAVRAMVLP
jgi:hypothetical protein